MDANHASPPVLSGRIGWYGFLFANRPKSSPSHPKKCPLHSPRNFAPGGLASVQETAAANVKK